MTGFAKLHNSILLSTVWREENPTRIVWITMLALADANGYVDASIPGLADAARVTITECETALGKFLSPDPYSRSKEYEGRRIQEVQGGWRILNHSRYRDGRDPDRRREQNRLAKQRQRGRQPESATVSHGQPASAESQPKSAVVSPHQPKQKQKQKQIRSPLPPNGGSNKDLVGRLFDYWVQKRGKLKAKLTAQRRRKIEARIHEGYTEEDLCRAIDGVAFSRHHRGENAEGRVWDDLALICRDGSHVEMFRDMPRSGGTSGPPLPVDDVATDDEFSDEAFYGGTVDN